MSVAQQADFTVKHIKFTDDIEGVQINCGELNKCGDKQYSCAFSYDLSKAGCDDYNEKIESCKRQILERIK